MINIQNPGQQWAKAGTHFSTNSDRGAYSLRVAPLLRDWGKSCRQGYSSSKTKKR
jgi:hypothetical protein